MEKEEHETEQMYQKRLRVFQNAVSSGELEKDAIVFANVWANMTYLNARYTKELEAAARRYFL